MLWIKAFHISAMVAWFAGLFYLPRLFVYHATAEDSTSKERFKTMERRLYRGIMLPAMLLTLSLGLYLAVLNWPLYQKAGWFHAKMLLVILLIGYHHYCGRHLRAFARDTNAYSSVYYRWFNEVPTLILLASIILVVVRPF